MVRGSREGCIIGGAGLLLLDLWGIAEGKLPLKGNFSTHISLAEEPELFWPYAIGLGTIGLAALVWGLTRKA